MQKGKSLTGKESSEADSAGHNMELIKKVIIYIVSCLDGLVDQICEYAKSIPMQIRAFCKAKYNSTYEMAPSQLESNRAVANYLID